MSAVQYESTANELVNRIRALVPDNPQILKMEDAWGLFKVPGFKCDDLAPSFSQACWALARARQLEGEK